MNVINRLVMVALIFVVIIVAAVIVIVPKQSFSLMEAFFDWAGQNTDHYLSSPTEWPIFAAARVFIGGAIVLICLFLLWLELRQPKAFGAQTVDVDAQCVLYVSGEAPSKMDCYGFSELGWDGEDQMGAEVENFLGLGDDCDLELER